MGFKLNSKVNLVFIIILFILIIFLFSFSRQNIDAELSALQFNCIQTFAAWQNIQPNIEGGWTTHPDGFGGTCQIGSNNINYRFDAFGNLISAYSG